MKTYFICFQASIDDARGLEMKMQAGIEAIHEMIKATRKSGVSQVADSAQEFISKSSIDLQKSFEDLQKAREELSLFDQFHGAVQSAKEKVEDQIKANLPELLASTQSGANDQESLRDVMVAYAMKKIDYLKKEIESVKQEERQRTESLLKTQRDEEGKRTETRLQIDAERMEKECELQLGKKVRCFHFVNGYWLCISSIYSIKFENIINKRNVC